MKIDSGIYMFKNIENGKVYIGQSKYLHSRYREHKSELINGIHHNSYFQRAVKVHGFDAFEYSVLERCQIAEFDAREAYYIELFDARNRAKGYNIREAGNESDLPVETVEKIRIANRGKNNKLSECEVEEIKVARLSGVTCSELAEKYGVTPGAINKITMCRNWVYVREDLNEKLLALSEEETVRKLERVKNLYKAGLRPHQIHRETGYGEAAIKKMLVEELAREKDIEEKVTEDFFRYLTIAEILDKYGITYAQYKRITKGLKPVRDKYLYGEIVRRRNAGELVKDIANSLGINRGTVNEIVKRFRDKEEIHDK